MTDADLVQALVSRRVANGWTQADLAARIGVHRSTVAHFEAPGRTSPTLFVINRYAAAVGMELQIGHFHGGRG